MQWKLQGMEKCKENASFLQKIENAGNHLHNCRGWKIQRMENGREKDRKMQRTENVRK